MAPTSRTWAICLIACVIGFQASNAAEPDPAPPTPDPAASVAMEEDVRTFHPIGITADAGTLGIGGAISWRFLDNLGVRAGLRHFSYTYDEFGDAFDVEEADAQGSAKLRLQSEPVALDVYPWKRSSFRVSLGVLFNQNELEGTLLPGEGTIDLAGTEYPLSDVGTLRGLAEQAPISPYVSIGGSLYLGKKHHWSLCGELGVAYTDSPEITLRRSGGIVSAELDAALRAEQDDLEDDASGLVLWPIIQVGVRFEF